MLQRTTKNVAGFSLLELMLSLSIVAIVMSFALPNYSKYIGNTKRLMVMNLLLVAAEQMEHFYADNHTYVGATLANLAIDNLDIQHQYQIKIMTATKTNFLLVATAIHGAVTDPCHIITLDAQGQLATPNTHDLTQCWQL